jgi:capsular polysaccharide biosynthesis protein
MNNFFDNQRILTLIWKRKIHFILVGIIAIILSAFFSSSTFITPKFKSTARIYPTNIWVLSDESETEQMLEITNSNDIKLKMFDTFQLDKVYEIGKDDPHYLTYMFDVYGTNVHTSKTEFETVEITVMDYDPQRAADMCDSIVHFYDKKVRDMQRIKEKEMVEITENGLRKKYQDLDSVMVKLDKLRKESGILDYNEQVPEVTRGYMNALANGRGSTSDAKKIKDLYNNMSEDGSKVIWLESRLDYLTQVIDSLSTEHDFYLSEYEKDITYSHVVEYPVPADKKSYPVRWMIVAFSTISAIFLALLVFLVLDYRKED